MGSVERVAATYMGLVVEEQKGRVIVKGPYLAISPHIPTLKKLHFQYDPRDKSWSHPVDSKTTAEKIKALLFGPSGAKGGDAKERQEALKDFPVDFRLFQVDRGPTDILIRGNTYPLRELFQKAGAMWVASQRAYRITVDTVSVKHLPELIRAMRAAEQKALKELAEEEARRKRNEAMGIKTLYRTTRPYDKGEMIEDRTGKAWVVVRPLPKSWVDEEDALSFGVRMDRSGWVYYAEARPATDEEVENSQLGQDRKVRQKKQDLVKVIDNLKQAIKRYPIPPGPIHLPKPFFTINAHRIPYGGGEWFVLDGSHIWYVRNSGGEGDDWGGNNVVTGGAGAIGWKAPLTPDIKELVETLQQSGITEI